jgi:hypothetical protein
MKRCDVRIGFQEPHDIALSTGPTAVDHRYPYVPDQA